MMTRSESKRATTVERAQGNTSKEQMTTHYQAACVSVGVPEAGSAAALLLAPTVGTLKAQATAATVESSSSEAACEEEAIGKSEPSEPGYDFEEMDRAVEKHMEVIMSLPSCCFLF